MQKIIGLFIILVVIGATIWRLATHEEPLHAEDYLQLGIERGVDQAMSETEILKRNVRELQEQLENSYIRIKKLRAKLMQNEKLLKMLRETP